MPAAAVIPAPIAYIKVVAVKKLVVEGGEFGRGSVERLDFSFESDDKGGWGIGRQAQDPWWPPRLL